MPENAGEAFQSSTSYSRESMEEYSLDWRSKPEEYKFYPHAPVVALPDPTAVPSDQSTSAASDLWNVIAMRRSVRSFCPTPLTLVQLSRLLWATNGITASFITPKGQEFYRAAPSAGALYPIETYVVVNNVEGLEPGLYHYRVAGLDILERPIAEGSHALELLRSGDLRHEIKRAALDQPMCAKAGAVFVWTAVFARSVWKYRQRAYRYCYLDAGHLGAHLSLAAVAEGLASCQVAAFYDDEANALLEIDGRTEATLYMAAVGTSARPFGGAGRVDLRHTSRPKE